MNNQIFCHMKMVNLQEIPTKRDSEFIVAINSEAYIILKTSVIRDNVDESRRHENVTKGKPSSENIRACDQHNQNHCRVTAFLNYCIEIPPMKSAEQPTTTSACDSLQMTGRPAPEGTEPPIALSVSVKVAVLLSTIGILNM